MLKQIYEDIYHHYGQSDQLVFGAGRQDTDIMLVGEAPGRDEVKNGIPFCGRAGENFDAFLAEIPMDRNDVFITNVCKFRPHRVSQKGTVSNRPPTRKEIEEAIPFLYREIEVIAPRCLVTLGNTPLRACLGCFDATIGVYHGKVTTTTIRNKEYPLFALYHPASTIYNPSLKPTYEEDLAVLSTLIKEM